MFLFISNLVSCLLQNGYKIEKREKEREKVTFVKTTIFKKRKAVAKIDKVLGVLSLPAEAEHLANSALIILKKG